MVPKKWHGSQMAEPVVGTARTSGCSAAAPGAVRARPGGALERGWRGGRRAERCLQKQVGWLGQREQKEVPGLGCARSRGWSPACLLPALSARSRGWLETLGRRDEPPRPEGEGSCCFRTAPKEPQLRLQGSPLPSRRPLCRKKSPNPGFAATQNPLEASPLPSRLLALRWTRDHFAAASVEVFQVRPSASHSLAAWDTEEILFIGARPLHVRRAFFFPPLIFFLYFLAPLSSWERLFPKQMRSRAVGRYRDVVCSGTTSKGATGLGAVVRGADPAPAAWVLGCGVQAGSHSRARPPGPDGTPPPRLRRHRDL